MSFVGKTLDVLFSLTSLYCRLYARLTRLLVSQDVFNISVDEGRGGSLKNKDIEGKVQGLNQNKICIYICISFVSFVI